MFTKRIIPCLDVHAGRVVKGVNFVNLRDAGDPVEIAAAYDAAGADELVFLDITASSDARATVVDMVRKVAEKGLSVKETERLVEKTLDRLYDARADGAKPRPIIVRMVKDYRLFMNTINSAINQLREAGMRVEVDQQDAPDGVDIHIFVRRP